MPRRPKPTALRELDNNAGHRPANGREPSIEITLPEPPDYLDERAREEWARVGRQLFMARVITALDRANFAAYCQAVSRHERAEVEMRAAETKIYADDADEKERGRAVYRFNVASGQRRQALNEVQRLGIEFGLTPASRAKIRVPDAQGELPFGVINGSVAEPDPLEASRRQLRGASH
jgi:P27 family predicted phage terminase small subunit